MKNYLFIIILFLLLYILYRTSYIHTENFEVLVKRIPKVLYLSYKTKDVPSYIIENWKELNPKYKIKLSDNDDCKKFLLDNYSQEHVDIFDFLEDGPIKADFWRVCILYKYGGVYSDIDVEPLVPIDSIIETDVTFLTCGSNVGSINPHFIMTVKNHPLLLDCIEKYISNYRDGIKYHYWTYGIPTIMNECIVKYIDYKSDQEGIYIDSNENKYQLLSEINPGNYNEMYCSYKSRKILNNRYEIYNSGSHAFENFELSVKTIPKVLYLSYKTKDIPSYIIDNWKNLNPEYEIYLYDNDDCRNFLLDNYSQQYVDLFDFLEDGPIKADFWRVCILYKYGGVYADVDIEPLVPIDSIIETDVTFLTCGSFAGGMNPHFIMTVPQHPLLLDCKNTYLKMYENQTPYNYWTYSIVFNVMIPNIKKYIDYNPDKEGVFSDKSGNKYQILSEIDTGDYNTMYCSYKSIKVLNNRYKKYNHETHSFENFLNYNSNR